MFRLRNLVRIFVMITVLALFPNQGGAFSGHEVDVYDNIFSDPSVNAQALDTVTWINREGRHNIVSYAGDQAVASRTIYLQGDPFVSSFGGGTILYRCTYHAKISSTGVCDGMCGAVTDRTAAPSTPTLRVASGVSEYGKVDLSGTGERWTTIILSEGGTTLAKALVGADGSWTAPIWVQSGDHAIRARAVDVDGRESLSSALATFTT